MANELPNAVALMESTTFEKWAKAASVYQARIVVTEPTTTADHAVRYQLAQSVVADPEWLTQRVVSVIATDPAVNSAGSDPVAIGQTIILKSISDAWTPLAKLMFPQGTP